jgi:hypothetical protein
MKKVQGHLLDVVLNFRLRSTMHDASKLQEPERSGYAGLTEALAGLTYGTPEYRAAFAPFEEIIQHHYAHNAHHPEHWPNGVNDMSLFDILEMLADWKAASERGGGDFAESFQVSVQRFGIGQPLQGILLNTVRELGWVDGEVTP